MPLQKLKPPAPPAAGVGLHRHLGDDGPRGNRFDIRLTQDAPGNATGVALPGNEHLFDGRVSGNRLIVKWAGLYVQLTLAPDGASFTAAWTNGATAGGLIAPDGTFNGYRFPANFPNGPTPGVPTNDGKKYSYPYITSSAGEAMLLDWCREWAVDCGKPAADAFCASVDGGQLPIASSFEDFQRAVRFRPSMTIGSKQICNDPACTGFEYIVCSASPVAAAPAPAPAPAPTGGHSIATIVVPDPNVHALNVRNGPNGTILTALPEGTQVSVVGDCGSPPAAGLAKAPASGTATPGWCQIDAPLAGWVSAKYLVFGGVGITAPAPSAQPAGLPPPPAITTFAGVWNARTGDGTPYTIALAQSGNTVTGSYQGGDGSQGTIVGSVNGKQLSFAWNQADGLAGFRPLRAQPRRTNLPRQLQHARDAPEDRRQLERLAAMRPEQTPPGAIRENLPMQVRHRLVGVALFALVAGGSIAFDAVPAAAQFVLPDNNIGINQPDTVPRTNPPPCAPGHHLNPQGQCVQDGTPDPVPHPFRQRAILAVPRCYALHAGAVLPQSATWCPAADGAAIGSPCQCPSPVGPPVNGVVR